MNSDVFIVRTAPRYSAFPYDSPPHLLDALRSLFLLWGQDPENPFKEWVGPGGRVVLKPNWVHHHSPHEEGLDGLVTHSSLVKHLIDLLAVALRGQGSILIGDAPLQLCDFQVLVERTRIGEVVSEARKKYPGLVIEVQDWRLTVLEEFTTQRHRGDYEHVLERDYEVVDLGRDSFLEDISDYADRFRVTCYDPRLMSSHHRAGKHEYLVTRKVFDVDLLLNLAKMKTHIKAGLTGALKNVIGINGHKEFLPHHIRGASDRGGDCYYKGNGVRDLHDAVYDTFWTRYGELSRSVRRAGFLVFGALWRTSRLLGGDSISWGSWHGNETVWRTTLDLNHLLYFGSHAPKRVISIVDGIMAGEGEGPLRPTPKPVGLLLGGENPAYVDATLARLIGYNISRVPTVYHAIFHRKSRFAGPYLEDFRVRLWEDGRAKALSLFDLPNLGFVKPQHWTRAELGDEGEMGARGSRAKTKTHAGSWQP
jgi:uncharacterized protein (DUF362 family)